MATLPSGETIVAIATPPGRGAIAVVRLSGPEVGATLRKQFRSRTPARALSRRPAVGHFLDERGSPVDEVLVTFYGAPFSYTGEDVGEISCHGSPVLASRIVDTLLQKGMRLAQPGEFTLRAFLSGKIDLTQAEAVRDLVDSQTEYQAKIAAEQLEGGLSQTLKPLREELIRVIAQLEAAVEFVEEYTRGRVSQRINLHPRVGRCRAQGTRGELPLGKNGPRRRCGDDYRETERGKIEHIQCPLTRGAGNHNRRSGYDQRRLGRDNRSRRYSNTIGGYGGNP